MRAHRLFPCHHFSSLQHNLSLLFTPAQRAATYAQMARQLAATASTPAVHCEATLPHGWPDTDSDFGVGMFAEVDEQPTVDVWILHDTGSAVTVCPPGFQGGSRCEAAAENAVTLGGAREVPVEIAETNFSFGFGVANATKPIVSGESLFQPGCTTVISKSGRCFVLTPSGQTIMLHLRRRAYWLKGRNSTVGELTVFDHSRNENSSRSARTPSCGSGSRR